MAVENWHVGWFFCKLLVALTAAELPRRRQLNAVSRWLVVGPNPAMQDHRPIAGHEALGALQPHRQTRRLGPLQWCISDHQESFEDKAGLGQQIGAVLGGLGIGSLERAADRLDRP